MKKENDRGNFIKRFWSGRAAQIFAVTATVFLCFMTVFEYVALRMEWDIPVLQMITGDSDSYIFQEYRNEEMALDDSTENVLFKEGYPVDMEAEEISDDENSGETLQNNETVDATENTNTDKTIENTENQNGDNTGNDKTADATEIQNTDEATDNTGTDKTTDNTQNAGNTGTDKIADTTEPQNSDKTADTTEPQNTDKTVDKTADTTENTKNAGNSQTDVASENTEAEDEFPYYIKVNRQQNCVTIYTKDENGEYTVPYKAMICSTGLYNATPCGTFHLSTKYLWRELFGNVYGQYATRITGGVLFHSVPYYKKSKNSLCSEKYNKLGQQASMGCIRLTVEDAKWIAENCPSGTAVEIYDDKDNPGPLGKPEAMKIDTDNPNKGWDPTDPDADNPWHELSDDE